MLTTRRDEGSLTLLVIGYASIAAVLVVAGIDASKVFLARRALSAAADAAALAAAQSVDRSALYAGGSGGCGSLLPLDPVGAEQRADETIDDDAADLGQTFATLDPPVTVAAAGTVSVHLGGEVAVPFGRILGMLVPGHADGRVHVDATSSAASPLSGPDGC